MQIKTVFSFTSITNAVAALILLAGTCGCVTTLEDPVPLAATVANAETNLNAIQDARRKLTQNNTVHVTDEAPIPVGSTQIPEAYQHQADTMPTSERKRNFNPQAVNEIQAPTSGLSALNDIRVIGSITGSDGNPKALLSQTEQPAVMFEIGQQLSHLGRTYEITAIQNGAVIVKSTDNLKFIIHR